MVRIMDLIGHYESFRRILKNNVIQYDVTLIHVAERGKIHVASSKKRFPNIERNIHKYIIIQLLNSVLADMRNY